MGPAGQRAPVRIKQQNQDSRSAETTTCCFDVHKSKEVAEVRHIAYQTIQGEPTRHKSGLCSKRVQNSATAWWCPASCTTDTIIIFGCRYRGACLQLEYINIQLPLVRGHRTLGTLLSMRWVCYAYCTLTFRVSPKRCTETKPAQWTL